VIRIPVGGNTRSGQHLKVFLLYQISLENEVPKVCHPAIPLHIQKLTMDQLLKELPKVEMVELESGSYYLNLHIVTGRKPAYPRPGDLLGDGTRQDMTASKYDAMARNDAELSWKRYCLITDLVFPWQHVWYANVGEDLILRASYRV
jgi:hypothetical protein